METGRIVRYEDETENKNIFLADDPILIKIDTLEVV